MGKTKRIERKIRRREWKIEEEKSEWGRNVRGTTLRREGNMEERKSEGRKEKRKGGEGERRRKEGKVEEETEKRKEGKTEEKERIKREDQKERMEQGRRENEKEKNKGIREGGKNGWREEWMEGRRRHKCRKREAVRWGRLKNPQNGYADWNPLKKRRECDTKGRGKKGEVEELRKDLGREGMKG
jgi:hypothetical protein